MNTRKAKADWIRSARDAGLSAESIRRLADREFGTPAKETLGDHWPARQMRCFDGTPYVCSHSSDGEAWVTKILIDDVCDDYELDYLFGSQFSQHDGGPGRSFTRSPIIERSNHSTLITSYGGLDI